MNVLTAEQFTREEVEKIIDISDRIRDNNNYSLKNKTMASLFYEPSTRTRLSFEAAMYKLHGNVISTENARQFSSAIKGESLEDTVRVVSTYCDLIVLRHYEKGSSKLAAKHSRVPIINAGDGGNEHPTQALLDIYTIRRETGRLDGLRVALVGDLKNGRTVHSLFNMLRLYNGIEIVLVSPAELRMPQDMLKFIKCWETDSLQKALAWKPDVIYMTRTQKERMTENMGKFSYQFEPRFLESLKDGAIIMHPLPRNDELPVELDLYKGSAYFRQAENGLWLRSGLLYYILGD